jgi:hypothetical protein
VCGPRNQPKVFDTALLVATIADRLGGQNEGFLTPWSKRREEGQTANDFVERHDD